MRVSKKRKLETKGWRVGDADDFLDLSPEESAYIELKLKLADSLRRTRIRLRFTQEKVASLLHSSQSRVAKMEAGDSSVSIDLMIRSLIELGVSNRDLGRIIARNG